MLTGCLEYCIRNWSWTKVRTGYNNSLQKDGWTVLHCGSSNGHLDIAKLLIEHNASVDLAEKDGWTALHDALRNGHLGIARLLIEHNASVNLVEEGG
jgi:ankyrin repeat protein